MPNWVGKLRVRNDYVREFMAEFLGTFVLIVIGDGSVAQKVLTNNNLATYISVNFGYGLAVAFGVYISGGVSGGHINPAVTLTMAVLGRLKWTKVPVYMLAQYLGAFTGAAVVFGVYHDLIDKMGRGVPGVDDMPTAGIFATYPYPDVSTSALLGDQILGTALLVMLVMSFLDENNSAPHKGFVPLLVGLVVVAIGLSFGVNAGYAINPARDLGPRLFTLAAGFSTNTFTVGDFYFWIPIVGPHLGALVGAAAYVFLIENNWKDDDPSSYSIPAIKPDSGKYNEDAYEVPEMRLSSV